MSDAPDRPTRSAVYVGRVHHARHAPRPHRFSYRLFHLYLDLDELDTVFAGSRLFSVERANVASFRRRDYLRPLDVPLKEAVRARVEERTGVAPPDGPIRLLTHVAFLGLCFNPVSFYYLFEPDGVTLHSIVAEITNTPWNERHQYVLLASEAERCDEWYEWRFDKDFHVSPFFGMDHTYHWRFTAPSMEPESRLGVAMENRVGEAGERVFDAALELVRRPLTPAQLRRCLVRHPWITGAVHAAIYWQAFRLWLKRTPFFAHPKSA
ncbi:MAG: DUF1365 domain-containing protein [Planctomycetota bacterium]